MKLTVHLFLVLRQWMHGAVSPLSICYYYVLLSYAQGLYCLPVLLLSSSSSSSSLSYVLLGASIHPVEAVHVHPFIWHNCPHGGPRHTYITTVYVRSTKQRNLTRFCWILPATSQPCDPRPILYPLAWGKLLLFSAFLVNNDVGFPVLVTLTAKFLLCFRQASVASTS